MRAVVSLAILTVVFGLCASAQESIDGGSSLPDAPSSTGPAAATLSDQLPHPNEHYFVKHLAQDQVAIWTSPEGRLLATFGQLGKRVEEFAYPKGLWVDSGNRLYVADAEKGRVQVSQMSFQK